MQEKQPAELCNGCDHKFKKDDLAYYQRNADGTFTQACRYCITSWIKEGILFAIPFWKRKEDEHLLQNT